MSSSRSWPPEASTSSSRSWPPEASTSSSRSWPPEASTSSSRSWPPEASTSSSRSWPPEASTSRSADDNANDAAVCSSRNDEYPPCDPVIREPAYESVVDSGEVFCTTGNWVLALSSVVKITDEKHFNPNCNCGGRPYLGTLRSIAMYKNHKSIDCVISPKKPFIPCLKPSYFNLLKIFESITEDSELVYETKAIHLIQTWERSHNILDSELRAGTHVFLYYAVGVSAIVILDPGWEKLNKSLKSWFSSVLIKILRALQNMKCHPEAITSCHVLLAIIDDPWGHHYLPKLFHHGLSEEEIFSFIEYEKSNLIALRLKLLCEGKCYDEALCMSSLAVMLYNNNESSRAHFSEDDIEFIRDIYFGCLLRLNKKEELGDELEKFVNQTNSKILLKRLSCKIGNLSKVPQEDCPTICETLLFIYGMIANIVLTNHFINANLYDEFSNILMLWCTFMLEYMELDKKMDDTSLKDMILSFTEIAPKAKYLYTYCDILDDYFGSTLPLSLFLEIYIKALQSNINEKEYNKLMKEKQFSMNSLTELFQGYLKLGNLVEDRLPHSISVYRECVLTAFTLIPTKGRMDEIQNLAIISGKLPSDKSVNVSAKNNSLVVSDITNNNCNTCESNKCLDTEVTYGVNDSYTLIRRDLNNLPDPVTLVMQQNLVSVLNYPRYGSFNWNLEWPQLKMKCQECLEMFDTVVGRNMLRPEDLKYLNMDVNTYTNIARANRKKNAALRKKPRVKLIVPVNFQKRQNLRSQKNVELIEESNVNSLLNNDTKVKSLNNDVEDSISVLKELVQRSKEEVHRTINLSINNYK